MLGGGFGGLRGFFNAYGAYPGIWVKKDGQLAYGAIQPECKTALAVLHDMYEKGYIDTEFGVKDSTKAGEAAAAGKYGFTFGQQWLSLTPFQSCKDNDPDSQWSAYPLPSATGEPAVAQADLGTNRWIAVNKIQPDGPPYGKPDPRKPGFQISCAHRAAEGAAVSDPAPFPVQQYFPDLPHGADG